MSNSDPYKKFEQQIAQCLTINENEFYQVIPSKYRGKEVAKVLYDYFTKELNDRKTQCIQLVNEIKDIKTQKTDLSAAEIESKISLIKTLRKASHKSIKQMEEEIHRRKLVIQKMKDSMGTIDPVDPTLSTKFVKQFNAISKKM